VISVGAYVTKTSWDCVAEVNPCGYVSPPAIGAAPSFSSPGPLRDGTPKPDIAAPGMGIGSSLSTDAESPLFTDPYAILTGGYHYVSQGTSQASPHVAGGVALLLENRPNLGVQDVRNAIILTARHDGFTGGGYNVQFGNGKFDVAAAHGLLTPVRLLSLDAVWEGDRAVVRWELSETEEGAVFRVERGPDRLGPFTAVSPVLGGGLSLAWTDPQPDPNHPWYRVVTTTRDGSSQVLGTVRLAPAVPRLRLWPGAPNPFTTSTAIAFELDRAGEARLEVLDVSGRSVAVLASGSLPAGRHEVIWDGTMSGGRQAGSGIYFLRLRTPGGAVLAQRVVLAR
jgi:hypothetical protein